MRRSLIPVLATVAAVAAILVGSPSGSPQAAAEPAPRAAITEVTGFGSNPGNLQMFRYVPAGLAAGRPVVVVLHGCTQNATGYGTASGWTTVADDLDVTLVLPQQRSANNANSCFTWFEAADTARGSGEAASIRQMVDRARADQGSGAAYVTGLSAGGAMTSALLAAYPDVFSGGGVVAGIPAGCATSTSTAFGCMNPGVDRTPAQWGDAVRRAGGGATPVAGGPRVSVFHGSSDTTVRPLNGGELVDQWTNVRGVDRTADSVTTVAGHRRSVFTTSGGVPAVEYWELPGVGHGQPIDPGSGAGRCGTATAYVLDVDLCAAYRMAAFWGLGDAGTPEEPEEPPTGSCVADHNWAHVQAGRAEQRGGYAYAVGSGDALGLANTYARSALRETSPGYHELVSGC